MALRRQTVHQGDTVADIHQQQVLDNLAKFVADPYSIPSFAVASSGSTQVADQGTAGLSLGWIRSGFSAAGLSLGGQRGQTTSWTTTPITDPRKLELMRCAYQRATSDCTGSPESICCPDCRKRFNEFYTGRAFASKTVLNRENKQVKVYECDGQGRLSNLVPSPCEDGQVCAKCGVSPSVMAGCPDSGQPSGGDSLPSPTTEGEEARCYCNRLAAPGEAEVNSECLYPQCGCWFCCGCKKCVPKGCKYVGHYGDTYVWIPPGPGRDELAKLTLAILDYAVHEDRRLPTKEVIAYVKRNGDSTTEDQAEFVVKATISSSDKNDSVLWSEAPPEKIVELMRRRGVLLREFSTNLNSSRTFQSFSEMSQKDQSNVETAMPEQFRELKSIDSQLQQFDSQRPEPVPPSPLPQQLSPMPNSSLLLLQQQLNTVQ
jgi:hypothetical protein